MGPLPAALGLQYSAEKASLRMYFFIAVQTAQVSQLMLFELARHFGQAGTAVYLLCYPDCLRYDLNNIGWQLWQSRQQYFKAIQC